MGLKISNRRYMAFLIFCLMYLLLIPWAAAQGNNYREAQIIVRLKDSSRIIDTSRLASLGLKVTSKEGIRSGLQLWHLDPGQDVQEAVYKVARDPAVLYAEPNYLYHSLDTVGQSVYVGVYGDPYRSEQWYLDAMSIPKAWQNMQQPGINQVTVAVVDSGIDGSHPDLPPLLEGFDFVKGSNTSSTSERKIEQNLPEDPLGHGTAIAGLIAAVAYNNEGIMGVANEIYAPHVQILPVRVLDSEGWGDAYTIAMGIRWAVGEEINGYRNDHPAAIINLSLGGEVYSSALEEAIRYAQQKGALIVAAAGNGGIEASSIFPASLPGVLTVGAAVYGSLVNGPGAESWRQASGWYLPYFTNYGREVEVLAPGVNILSTHPLGLAGDGPAPGYKWFNGTSFAAGLVSGLAALVEASGDSWRGGLLADLLANSGPKLVSSSYTYRLAEGDILEDAGEYSPPAVAILDPKPGEVINGVTDIAVALGGQTELVELTLVGPDDKEIIHVGQVRGIPFSVQLFTWNLSSFVTPGNYRIMATAYNDDQVLGRTNIDITIAGNITIMVKPPAEFTSASTEIALVAGDNPQQVIWRGQTDYLGKVVIPTEVAARTAGTIIMAYGLREMETRTPGGKIQSARTPYFFYWRKLDAPLKTSLVLDGHDAIPLQINENLTNWQWVENRAWATLLDENCRPIFGFLAAFASAQDGQEPEQEIFYVTPGKYAFRIKGVYLDLTREKMVLALKDDMVNVNKEGITLSIDPNKLASLQWNWHHFSGARLFALDIDLTLENNKIPYNDQYFGFKKEDFSFAYLPGGEGYSPLQELLVTPGTYKATLLMGKKEITTGNFLWSYTFEVPELNIPPEGVALGLSPDLQGSLILNGGRLKAGEVIPFSLKVDDGWGQQLVRGWDGLLGEIKPAISLQAADGTMIPLTSYKVDYLGGWLLLPSGISPGLYTLEVGSFTLHSPWAGRETPATTSLEIYADENAPKIPGQEPESNPGSSNNGGTGNRDNGGNGEALNTGKSEETKPYYAVISSSDEDTTLTTPGEELTVLFPRGSLPEHTTVSLTPAGDEQVRILQDKSSPFSGKLLAAFELAAIRENGQPITAASSPLTLNFKLRAIKGSQTTWNGAANEINNPGCYIYDPVYATLIPLSSSYRKVDGQIMVSTRLIGLYALVEEEPMAIYGLRKDDWYASAVSKLACRNLLPEPLKASFKPNAVLTRAQAARLVALAGQIPGRKDGAVFPDLQDERLAVFIDSLAAEGLVSGYPDGSFQPQRSVTRAEMTALICRVLDGTQGKPEGINNFISKNVFHDVNKDCWAYGAIQKGTVIGFIGGYPDGNFKPEAPVSWAEAASMVTRAFPGLFEGWE